MNFGAGGGGGSNKADKGGDDSNGEEPSGGGGQDASGGNGGDERDLLLTPSPGPTDEFDGWYGTLKWMLSGGKSDGYEYDWDGNPLKPAPFMGELHRCLALKLVRS